MQVFVFTKEFYVHFWYVSTLIKLDTNSKKVKKKIKNDENTLLYIVLISKKKFLKNIFVKWCKHVISVKVFDFIK